MTDQTLKPGTDTGLPDDSTNRFEWLQKVLQADMPPTTRMVGAAIGVTFVDQNGKVMAGAPALSDYLGMSGNRMREALSQLEKRGWLARVEDSDSSRRVRSRKITFPRSLAGA